MRASQCWLVKPEISRFPCKRVCTHARVSDHAGSPKHLQWRAWSCCFLLSEQHQHPGFDSYRGSMAGLCVPLSTLHVVPRDTPCMTRGQYESLLLYCLGLSPVFSLPVFTGALTLKRTRYQANEPARQRKDLPNTCCTSIHPANRAFYNYRKLLSPSSCKPPTRLLRRRFP